MASAYCPRYLEILQRSAIMSSDFLGLFQPTYLTKTGEEMGDFHSNDRMSPEASGIFNDRRPLEPRIPSLTMDMDYLAFRTQFHLIEGLTFTTFDSLRDEIAVANKREGRYPKELRKKIDSVFAAARMMKLPDMVLAQFMDEIGEKLAIDRRKNCSPWWEDLF